MKINYKIICAILYFLCIARTVSCSAKHMISFEMLELMQSKAREDHNQRAISVFERIEDGKINAEHFHYDESDSFYGVWIINSPDSLAVILSKNDEPLVTQIYQQVDEKAKNDISELYKIEKNLEDKYPEAKEKLKKLRNGIDLARKMYQQGNIVQAIGEINNAHEMAERIEKEWSQSGVQKPIDSIKIRIPQKDSLLGTKGGIDHKPPIKLPR